MYSVINIGGGVVILSVFVVGLLRRSENHPTLSRRYFQRSWRQLQKQCSDKKLWCKAIIDADNLLDEALKQRHFKGKSTGERIVSAQRYFTSNDAVWLGHKLKNKITDNDLKRLSKKDTLEALAAFKLALKDLGALSPRKKGKAR